MILNEEKVFKDPIHQYIYVDDQIIWELINAKEFQRLRRIKQLGTTYLTFHGAEHSRFSHSLGVYEITRKIISMFKRNKYEEWSEEERLVTLIAGLLHDVGHGAFSHSMEMAFSFNHEEWTKEIILGDSDINKILSKFDAKMPKIITDILNKKYNKPIVENIISSQLDADRMDYLLRDAYFTGVNYGTFDLERILRVLRPYGKQILVKESGMHSIEDYLMSRYQMYWQVYFHPVTRSGEIVLRKIFKRAKDLYENEYHFDTLFTPIKRLFDKSIDIHDYFWLDDSFFNTQFYFWAKEKDVILSELTTRFINRRLFHYVDIDPDDKERLNRINEFFDDNNIDKRYYLELDSPSDLPYDIYKPGEDIMKPPIYLLANNGEPIEISRKSTIIASITGKPKTEYRLYYPLDILKDKNLEQKFMQLV